MVLFTLTGCKEAIHNSGEDNNYIRLSGESASEDASLKSKLPTGSLLPTKPGNLWRSKASFAQLPNAANRGQDLTRDINGNPFPVKYEKTVCRGTVPLAGGSGTGTLFETRVENGTASLQTEIYQVNAKGIYLSRSTGEQALTLIPPVPILRLPVQEDDIQKWVGSARVKDSTKTYPAVAFSRVRDLEQVGNNPTRTTYHIETRIIANVDGNQILFAMHRWFEPGVGIVRRVYNDGKLERTKELISYNP